MAAEQELQLEVVEYLSQQGRTPKGVPRLVHHYRIVSVGRGHLLFAHMVSWKGCSSEGGSVPVLSCVGSLCVAVRATAIADREGRG